MLASASSPAGYSRFGDTFYFIKKQFLFGLLPGLFLFLILARLNYHLLQKFSGLIYLFSLMILALVFVPGVGLVLNGSRSWIQFFGLSLQPSEIAKLAVVIILAKLLSENRDLKDWKNGLVPVLAIISPAVLLVAAQPDVGTLAILVVIIFAMLYLADVPKIYLAILGLVGVVGFAGLLLFTPLRAQRITTFLHPELDPKGIGYQINQSFLAVGSGGIFGLGLGHSRQKFQYLPEVQADSIFAVIAEEMGLIITMALVMFITFLGIRGLKIAKGAPDQFGRLLSAGIMIWFVWQSFLNISTTIGLLPLTGVPLPFISHGGSAMLVMLAGFGIVANVSKFNK
ncbi:MAG: Stage V sporulation protein E [Candidatus Magasanikbacteria bacterium GW2011_GWA2_40_10]|uniref:Probable peptidoglycan glycosyltransferase FtsW n=1 Tax=Candidatus Magasanikbacteria bacterium GW2011_GWA2_40_10 TaxID=1619037 RepID=A0A0G0QDW3_9BACT|nr:MAG: Stage V sporulation protein E [Candidatus Magasanikbacteria bacterium GW2011_GWA2_40_10]